MSTSALHLDRAGGNSCLNAHWQLTHRGLFCVHPQLWWLFMVLPEGLRLMPPTEVYNFYTVPWAWCTWSDDPGIPNLLLSYYCKALSPFCCFNGKQVMVRRQHSGDAFLSSPRVWTLNSGHQSSRTSILSG